MMVESSPGLMLVCAVTRFNSYPRVEGRTAPAADEPTEYKQLGLPSMDDGFRRVSLVAVCPSEGLLTDPTAAT
jgi:hypothetical protein